MTFSYAPHRFACMLFAAGMLSACASPRPNDERIAAAPAADASGSFQTPQLDFEKYTLPNGLEVILLEDDRLPLVAVNLWYHVGPANERPDRTGFAHLFEHMMFQGSKHVPDDAHFRLLEAAGASGINGTTDFDRTNYFETLPSNELELALWLESDRMGFMLETLDRAKLANQRDVVRNERRQSVENAPYGLVEEEMFHQLFPKGHPYYASVIGSHADIEAARLDDVREFFRQYYGPNNASLAIVGDIDKAKTRALVEKYFGPIPAGPPVPAIAVRTPLITAERRAVVTDRIELPRVYMAWLTPAIYTPGDAESALLADILGGGKSSRLYERLVYELRIAQDVTASQSSLMLGSVFYIQATAKPGVKPERLEQAIDAELERLRTEGPTPSELARAQNTVESSIIRGLETLGGFGGVADRLNRYNHYLRDPDYLAQDLVRYRSATPAALKRVAQRHLGERSRVVVYGVPGQKIIKDPPRTAVSSAKAEERGGTTAPEAPTRWAIDQSWRESPPASAPPPDLTLPVPQRFKLDNGLTVLLAERHDLPVMAASLVVLRGSDANPPEQPGLAAFTADMLDEGTARRSAIELAHAAAQIGATFGTSSSSDASAVAVRTLERNADAAFDLLADVALKPVFAAGEIDRVRNDRITQLLQLRDNPNALATKVFSQMLYGTRHPYGYIELGTEESLRAISRADLVEFWKDGYAPGNAALIVAGDLSLAELRALANKHFGSWQGTASGVERPAIQAPAERRVVVVDQAGAPQTSLRVGQIGVPRANPDYVALEVMNTGFGGLFSSRINMNLREKNGYTYGARSGFSFRRGAGPFVIATSVRTDATAEAVREIFGELERLRTEPISASELKLATDAVVRSLPAMFETTRDATSSLGELFVYELPLDYYNRLPEKVRAVREADVLRVAGQYLKPKSMVVVAVGDRQTIAPALKQLELGRLEVRDLEGKPAT